MARRALRLVLGSAAHPLLLFCLAAFPLFVPGRAAGQPVRGRVLESLGVRSRVARHELTIQFSVPIRVLRHSPGARGTLLQIAVEPLQLDSADLPAFRRDESLLPPRGIDDLPLAEVRYRGDQPGSPVLELRFEREVRFEVRAGKDFRSVVIEVERHRVDGYAVQLGAAPEPGAPPPVLPELPALRGRRVYVATITQGDRTWRRLRLGFFSDRSDAEATAAQLEHAFPGAIVVEVTQREARLSQASEVPQPRAAEPPSGTPAPDLVTRLMDEANRAMTGGEYAKATLIYTQVLSMPESDRSPEAQELLGLARERSEQFAHAKAEYEEYLRRYPEGEGAGRVRQRLAALITASAPQREPLEPEREREREDDLPARFDNTASLFASYRHETLVFEDQENDDTLSDSSVFTDAFFDSRFSGERYTARGQLSGGYYYDFLGSGASGMHLSSAFLEGNAPGLGMSASLGRRSLSTSGVLGRYDGGRLAKRIGERFEGALVSGFPVDSPSQDSVDTERYFVGGSLAGDRFFDLFDAEIFAIHQMVGSAIDRSALGGELRYFQDGRSLFGYLDYDVHFLSLNIAQLSGNAQLGERAFVHLLADYRNAPILTTSNALQGQLVSSLGDLEDVLSDSQIARLAEDRTAQSLFLNLGGSYNLRDDLQLAADASATHLSGTGDSGDCSDPTSTTCVPGFGGTGFEYGYSTQLIANGLLRAGDVGIARLRYLDGSAYDAATLTLSTRQPFTEFLRLEPSLLSEYRFRKNGFGDELLLRPGLGVEFRRWKFDVELEGGADWLRREGAGDELGWFGMFGIRYDY